MSKNRTLILVGLVVATIAYFAIPKLQAAPRFRGQSGSINLVGY